MLKAHYPHNLCHKIHICIINVLNTLLKMLNTLLEKLRQVANVFKSFTESFFGKSSSGGAGAGNKYVDTAEGITGSL